MVAIVHHMFDGPKEWNVDMGQPYQHMFEFYNVVTVVEADGLEMRQIINTVHNIPYIKGATKQVWSGDLARMVVQALI